MGLGCDPGSGFDCQEGLERWRTGWSDEKRRWCCEDQGVGCQGLADAQITAKYMRSTNPARMARISSKLASLCLIGAGLLALLGFGVHALCRRQRFGDIFAPRHAVL